MAKSDLPSDFVETANQRFTEALRFWRNWRGTAREEYAFVSGDQWLADDVRILKEQKRPPITFNYSEKMIDAVVGAEVANRQEVTYKPREITDAGLSDLWTSAAKWVRDEADIDEEESDAFRDCLICGMGWTHTRVSYDEEPDGMIEVNRVDPLEMIADPSAVKRGLKDRRYNFRLQWVDERVAKRQWPDSIALSTDNEITDQTTDTIRRGHRYEGDEVDDPDLHRGQVQIRHYECVELEPYYRVATENQILEVSMADFPAMKTSLDQAGITYVKQFKRVYYYAYFANETLLEGGLSPTQAGFTYQPITGKRDRNRNTYYGLTRVMSDPQRWANKWLSQILHIINSNAKGGLLAEVNAFVDSDKAQSEWAAPDSIVFLREGALSGNKVKEKQMAQYPTGLDRLMEFALASLPQVTGINLEALGLAGREQANVLEQSRKQAAYGLLAPIFDALRSYRKSQGAVLLDFIHNYISDNRLIRIGGPDSQQFVPLTKAPKAPRYDIVIDQSPNSPDAKQKTWEVLQAILPNMMKAGIPIPPDLLDYSPLPTALSIKWKQFIAQNKQNVSPEQVQKLQQEMQKLQEENMKLQQAVKDRTAEIKLKQFEVMQNIKLKQAEVAAEIQLKRETTDAELTMQAEKTRKEIDLKRQQVESDSTAHMTEVIQSGANEASSNVLKAINDLIANIGKLSNEAEADSKED